MEESNFKKFEFYNDMVTANPQSPAVWVCVCVFAWGFGVRRYVNKQSSVVDAIKIRSLRLRKKLDHFENESILVYL